MGVGYCSYKLSPTQGERPLSARSGQVAVGNSRYALTGLKVGAAAQSSNKPTEAYRRHGDEPCGELHPPHQHGVIAEEALKPWIALINPVNGNG